MTTIKNIPPLSPSLFFRVSAHVPHRNTPKKICLPDTSSLLLEESFAKVTLSWHKSGFSVAVAVKKGIDEVHFPDVTKGDGVELFINTHEVKGVHSVTRFCHYFIFLPKEVEGAQGHEVTRFHSGESHELADSSLFTVRVEAKKGSYSMEIEIPKEALHGYDPDECNRLGFTYRINRYGGAPQHFAVSSRFFAIEKHPQLWGTLFLEE
jgi:hypothetical protein